MAINTGTPYTTNVTTAVANTTPQQPASAGPFAAMGGGVQVNGGWVPKDHPLAAQAQPKAAVTNPPQAPMPAPAPQPAQAAPVAPAAPENTDVFGKAILEQFNALKNPTTAEDPSIKAQTDAFNLQQSRGLEDARRALAERAYASGELGSGGYDTRQQLAGERASANKANFLGDVMSRREEARQQQLLQALGMGSEIEQRTADRLQQESQFGRNLTENTRQFDVGQTNEESRFSRNLSENVRQFDATKEQRASEHAAQMGFNYAQMSQQDKQFFENLAFQKWQQEQQMAIQREGISASSGSASASLGFQKERALADDQRWRAYNTDEVIAARNAAMLKELGWGGFAE